MAETIIIGSGLAGLLAACKFPDACIYEAGVRGQGHKALLRFRDRSVSDLTGIPFKEVEVRKEIWYEGSSIKDCHIALANMYSRKMTGTYVDRSIWNLDPAKRYIAPEYFYDKLVDLHDSRNMIAWNSPIARGDIRPVGEDGTRQFINTAPLPKIMEAVGMESVKFSFDNSPIYVDRYRLPKGSDIYQTIYLPSPDLRTFRASITGDVLIVERIAGNHPDRFEFPFDKDEEFAFVIDAFGLAANVEYDVIDSTTQPYGKIVNLPREQRESILYELTREFNVFSVGRFATWRNIILDDVAKDLNVVERLMAASSYGRELVLANR
jgi:hypothetical protein